MSPPLNVYALSDAPPAAEVRGALGEAVRALRAGALFALAGEVDQPPELTADAVRAHDAAVRRLAVACPALLPVRITTTHLNCTRSTRNWIFRSRLKAATPRKFEGRSSTRWTAMC